MLLCQKHLWHHFSTVLGYKNLKCLTSNGTFLFERPAVFNVSSMLKVAQMHWTNWLLWHESMVNVLLEIPPSPTINGAKLTLAPGILVPKKDGLCLGWSHCRILLGHTLGGTQVEADRVDVMSGGTKNHPHWRKVRSTPRERCLKTKIRPKCETYEVFSARKKNGGF